MIPTVALLGRPNVGKSTLFNRLIGRRDAIVEDTPGVTRDRHYGTSDWGGRSFRVIDTGGLLPGSDDVFEAAIREQADVAISEADVILFLVDARAGITPIDRSIVEYVRRSEKPVVLVLNKADSDELDRTAYEFYELGLDRPWPVSAINGKGTGDLLDHVLTLLPGGAEEDEEDERLKVALVGRPNVGKSSIVNALLGVDRSIVTDIAGTTRDSVDSVLRYHGEEILLVDTAGLRRRSKIEQGIESYSAVRTIRAIGRADVVVLVVDAERGFERQEGRILTEAAEKRKGLVIAINKWDLIAAETNTAAKFEQSIRDAVPMLSYVPIVTISAVTRQRLVKVIEIARSVDEERKKRIPTHELNDAFLAAIADHPPPAVRGKDLRINFVVQPQVAPPVFLCFTNHPDLVPEHYTRYLENVLRRQYGFFGTPITIVYKQKNRLREDGRSVRTM